MPKHSIRLHPLAAQEIEAAFDWYFVRSPRSANSFLNQVNQAIFQIQESPGTWPSYDHGTRHYIITGFPFQIIYRQRDSIIEIIAIAHGKRKPNYWSNRA